MWLKTGDTQTLGRAKTLVLLRAQYKLSENFNRMQILG